MFQNIRSNRIARFFWILLDLWLAYEWGMSALEHFAYGRIGWGIFSAVFAIWCFSDVFIE